MGVSFNPVYTEYAAFISLKGEHCGLLKLDYTINKMILH
jgi:hypothetical protein